MKQTFDKLLWEAVQEYRDKTMVVDNHHAYGIIKDRVDSFWEQVRLLQADDDQMMILGGLLGIAMSCQLCAENLSLTHEQMGVNDSADLAEQEADAAKALYRDLMQHIETNKHRIESLQKGTTRYAVEFDEHELAELRQTLEELE